MKRLVLVCIVVPNLCFASIDVRMLYIKAVADFSTCGNALMPWGDKIGEFNLQQGENVEVSVDLESREYNGRWYTDVKAWKVSRDSVGAANAYSNIEQSRNEIEDETNLSLGDDDIPF